MDEEISFTDVDLKQEKFEDKEEETKKFSCDLCDKEMVYKMALQLLEGLSTACVDNTTGDIFKSPGTVAADIRKEMLDYLTERSESFVAETFLSEETGEEERGDQPNDIISEFIEDFAALKRNILSRVSGWVLSEMREDKIDDFVQEMELNSFWLLDRREAFAKTLIKNVDFKNEFHCNMKFKLEDDLNQHRPQCGFRTMLCENEGCSATFSAAKLEQHDSICPFKILPCEQGCPEILMRREMDRHCITVCPMKLMNCPFYSVGCQARVPSCKIEEHYSDSVRSHLMHALRYIHKGASPEDVAPRADQIEQESYDRLAAIQGVRPFTNAVKDLDEKLGPLEVVNKQVNVEDTNQLTSQQPASEDKNEPDAKLGPIEVGNKQANVEDTNQSNSQQPPSKDKIEPDANLGPIEVVNKQANVEDSDQLNSQEPSSEGKNDSDAKLGPLEVVNNQVNVEDTDQSNAPKPPSEDKIEPESEKHSLEETIKPDNYPTTRTPESSYSDQAPSEDPGNPNHKDTVLDEQNKVDSEVPPTGDFNKVEL